MLQKKTGNLIALKNVNDSEDLMVINQSGITIAIGIDTLRVMGRATQGVKAIRLKEKIKLHLLQRFQNGRKMKILKKKMNQLK